MYRLQSLAILVGIVGLFALVGYALFGWIGVVFILIGSLFLNMIAVGGSARMILALHRARPLSFHEAPDLHRLADTLAHRAGVHVPRLAVYPSDMPNAFALGTQGGIIAMSTGMLNLLDHREITGVLAHEFAHLKNSDSLLNLSAGLFVQAIASVSSLFGLLAFFLFLSGAWMQFGAALLPLILLTGVAPYIAYVLQAALMRTREYLADRDGARLSGDPRGLASALYKLEQYNRYLSRLQRRFRFIYTTNPETGPAWLRTHPATEDRIRALLDIEARTNPDASRVSTPRRIAVM